MRSCSAARWNWLPWKEGSFKKLGMHVRTHRSTSAIHTPRDWLRKRKRTLAWKRERARAIPVAGASGSCKSLRRLSLLLQLASGRILLEHFQPVGRRARLFDFLRLRLKIGTGSRKERERRRREKKGNQSDRRKIEDRRKKKKKYIHTYTSFPLVFLFLSFQEGKLPNRRGGGEWN